LVKRGCLIKLTCDISVHTPPQTRRRFSALTPRTPENRENAEKRPCIPIPAIRLFQAEIAANPNPIQTAFDNSDPFHHPPVHQPPPLQIYNPHTSGPLPDPARSIAGSRQTIPNNPGANGRRSARSVHPSNPNKLWCTKSHHWVLKDVFGPMNTCSACREKDRQRSAHQRQQQLQAITEDRLAANVPSAALAPPVTGGDM